MLTGQLCLAPPDCSLRDATCVMFEAPVLAAAAYYSACQKLQVEASKFSARWPHKDADGRLLTWMDVFDVDEAEAAEAAEAIEKDVFEFHEQQTY